MSRERHVHITRTTELPTKTYHIVKHHFTPIRYEPGVEVIRKPTVEHKVITSGTGLSGDMSSGYRGPRRRETIQIVRSPTATYADVGGYAPPKTKKVVKVVGGGVIGDGVLDQFPSLSTSTSSFSSTSGYAPTAQPASFVSLQKTMEGELERRRQDWEQEVEKMQQGFFDMKTSDSESASASTNRFADVDVRSRGGEILTVGDSRELFHELPDGSRVYRQKFDLYGFDTDNLSVRAEDGKLTITASKEEIIGGATSVRQFKRTVDIPDAVDQDQISSFLDEDGILTIEAPVIESRVNVDVGRRRDVGGGVGGASTSTSSLRYRHDDADDGFPPGFDEVVDVNRTPPSTSTSSSASTSFSRRRYLGPDVEETPYGRKLKTSLYIGRKYKADDITVKLYDYKISVDARSEETVAGRTAKRQFARDIDIPGPVDRMSFRAIFGDDGRLYLGGSFTGNDDHEAVTRSVEEDMPAKGRSVNVMF